MKTFILIFWVLLDSTTTGVVIDRYETEQECLNQIPVKVALYEQKDVVITKTKCIPLL